MLYSVYAVLGVCCTGCMLYWVYAVLGVCCTGCILVLGVCCTRCQLTIMTWRDREGWLNSVFCNDGRVVDKKEKDGGWRWEQCGGYERIWEIRGTTCLIGLGIPRISIITHRIGTCTCCIGDGKLPHTRNPLKSQVLMIFSPISSHLSLSRPQLYHHLRTRSYVIALSLSMPWSRVNTENRKHCIMHYPSIDCLPLPGTLSSPSRPCCTLFYTFQQLRVNQWIESQLPSRLPPELPPPDWPPPSSPPILLDHSLQVHLETRLITASKCISKLARLRPPNPLNHCLEVHLQTRSTTASKCISNYAWLRPPSSHDHGLQVHLQTRSITASKCIPQLARSQPPSVSLNSHDSGLQTRSITASKFAQSWPPHASPNSVDHSLQVYLLTRSITASNCISKYAWLRPPCSHDHGVQVHLQTCLITASKYIFKEQQLVYGNTGVTEVDRVTGSIFGRPRSR